MRYIYFFMLLSALFHAQKLQVTDSETGMPVANARIILNDQILYTNDDGFAPVEASVTKFEVSASGYAKENVAAFRNMVRLKPSVKEIDEVKIISIDLKPLLEDLHLNYERRYYDKPSVYDITHKEKKFNNDHLFFMVIAEAKLWTKTNSYDYKDGLRKKYDDILQIQLNNVKYMKENKSGDLFNTKTNEFNHADMGNYFFSFEITRILANMRMKESKTSGKIIADEGGEQLIKVKVKSENGIVIDGEFKYNKADKVITYYSMNYQQAGFKPYERTNTDGKIYEYQLGDVITTYEFYKKGKTYLPSLRRTEGSKFYISYDDKKDERKSVSETVYNTFSEAGKKGIDNRVDFTKSIWENVPVKDSRENTIMLSQEEQEFISKI